MLLAKNTTMKYIILITVFASLGAMIYGFNLEVEESAVADKYIGSGTVGLFLIAMPLFLYKESKGKKMDDYLLNDKNVRKMQGRPPKEE